jgi:hypothetical protein
VYLRYAHTHGVMAALLAPHGDYYSGVANVAALLATRIVPLEAAPHVTTSLALLCQLAPFLVVLIAPSPLWDSNIKRLLVCGTILLFPTGEVWLNTLGSQFHLSLAAALILLVDLRSVGGPGRVFLNIVLGIASLAGPSTAFLLPVYAIVANAERDRERWRQCAIVACGFLVQAAAFTWTLVRVVGGDDRLSGFNWLIFTKIYMDGGLAHSVLFQRHYQEFPRLTWAASAAIAVVSTRAIHDRTIRTALLAMLALSVGSLATSIGMRGGERYFFASDVLILTIAIASSSRIGQRVSLVGIVATVLVACGLFRSTVTYQRRMELFDRPGGAVWRNEVARWRADPKYRPRIPPDWGAEWRIDLNP